MSSDRQKLLLRSGPVVETIERLVARIFERFGDCGLYRLCIQLHRIAKEDTRRAAKIARGSIGLRLLIFVTLAAAISILGWVLTLIDFTRTGDDSVYSLLQGIEAAANLTVLAGAAILSVLKLQERLKRRRALAALNELRSIVHVIDMHQLTKDPSKFVIRKNTPSSPPLVLNQFQMTRYLDYCSEMLSLTSKVAVLFSQSVDDQTVGDVVSDIERVGAGLSQKIWQKIMILQQLETAPDAAALPPRDGEKAAIPVTD